MGQNSKIQWTHHTFNHWRGCTKVSPGCANRYAETLSKRNPAVLGVWGDKGTRVVAAESKWREPLKWDREAKAAGERHRVFCASLADVFEDWRGPMVDASDRTLYDCGDGVWTAAEDVNLRKFPGFCPGNDVFAVKMKDVRSRLWELIEETPHLDWLLVTKRPENVASMLPRHGIPDNVWLGVSAENQEQADKRIPILLSIPAKIRFVSCEPMLGPVDFSKWMSCLGISRDENGSDLGSASGGSDLDWLILGGESGPNARPCNVEWIRQGVKQCREAGVKVFVKQLGARPFWRPKDGPCPIFPEHVKIKYQRGYETSEHGIVTRDPKGGEMDEWPDELRVREVPR